MIEFHLAEAEVDGFEVSAWVRDPSRPNLWWRAVSDGQYNGPSNGLTPDEPGYGTILDYLERGWHEHGCSCRLLDEEPCRREPIYIDQSDHEDRKAPEDYTVSYDRNDT
jgi:hypothetical protein